MLFTTLSWLLSLCNKFWNLNLWVLHLCSSFSSMSWLTWVLCLSSWKDWHTGWCLTWAVRPAGFPASLSLSSSLILLPWLSVFGSKHGQCLLWACSGPQICPSPSLPIAFLSWTLCPIPSELGFISHHALLLWWLICFYPFSRRWLWSSSRLQLFVLMTFK